MTVVTTCPAPTAWGLHAVLFGLEMCLSSLLFVIYLVVWIYDYLQAGSREDLVKKHKAFGALGGVQNFAVSTYSTLAALPSVAAMPAILFMQGYVLRTDGAHTHCVQWIRPVALAFTFFFSGLALAATYRMHVFEGGVFALLRGTSFAFLTFAVLSTSTEARIWWMVLFAVTHAVSFLVLFVGFLRFRSMFWKLPESEGIRRLLDVGALIFNGLVVVSMFLFCILSSQMFNPGNTNGLDENGYRMYFLTCFFVLLGVVCNFVAARAYPLDDQRLEARNY
jgi:hypothetical protein